MIITNGGVQSSAQMLPQIKNQSESVKSFRIRIRCGHFKCESLDRFDFGARSNGTDVKRDEEPAAWLSAESQTSKHVDGSSRPHVKAPLWSFSLLAPPSVLEVFIVYFSVVNTQLR